MTAVLIQPIFNENGKNIGSILSPLINKKVNPDEKEAIEESLMNHVHEYYADKSVSIYKCSDMDKPSVVAIENINDLQGKETQL
jgi:hypothetical protein